MLRARVIVCAMPAQLALFADPTLPEGFRYQPDFLSLDEEAALIERFASLPFKPFEFRQYLGKRRVVYFGYRYDYQRGVMDEAAEVPAWLIPIQGRAAAFAGLPPDRLVQAMVTEYDIGAPIGWHRDRPQFEDIFGISLASPCTFRFRRKAGDRWQRASLTAEPRSIYLLRGPARNDWQHSIPPVAARRYSITFRTLR
jgi:alkylated DNA repair dioxygenase AlkB